MSCIFFFTEVWSFLRVSTFRSEVVAPKSGCIGSSECPVQPFLLSVFVRLFCFVSFCLAPSPLSQSFHSLTITLVSLVPAAGVVCLHPSQVKRRPISPPSLSPLLSITVPPEPPLLMYICYSDLPLHPPLPGALPSLFPAALQPKITLPVGKSWGI